MLARSGQRSNAVRCGIEGSCKILGGVRYIAADSTGGNTPLMKSFSWYSPQRKYYPGDFSFQIRFLTLQCDGTGKFYPYKTFPPVLSLQDFYYVLGLKWVNAKVMWTEIAMNGDWLNTVGRIT